MRLTKDRVLIIALNTAIEWEQELIHANAHCKDADSKRTIRFSKRLIEAYKRELQNLDKGKTKCQS